MVANGIINWKNLEYSTRSENMLHAFNNGIIISKKGSQRYNHKLMKVMLCISNKVRKN